MVHQFLSDQDTPIVLLNSQSWYIWSFVWLCNSILLTTSSPMPAFFCYTTDTQSARERLIGVGVRPLQVETSKSNGWWHGYDAITRWTCYHLFLLDQDIQTTWRSWSSTILLNSQSTAVSLFLVLVGDWTYPCGGGLMVFFSFFVFCRHRNCHLDRSLEILTILKA